MRDEDKSKAQLISELHELRRQLKAQQATACSGRAASANKHDELTSARRQSRKELSDSRAETEASNKALAESRETLRTSEQKLSNDHERYNILGDLIPFGVWTADAKGTITFLSDAFLEMSGISPEETARLEWIDQLARPAVLKAISDWGSSLNEGDIWEGEFTVTSQEGRQYDILIRGVPLLDKAGETLSWLGINLDISQRKRTEEALRESENRYRTFINSTSDLVFLKDDQFKYIVVNNSFAKYYGKKPEEVIGLSDFDLMSEEAAKSCRNSDTNAIATSKAYITEESIGDRVFETLKFPVLLENKKIGVGGYIRDITERKQAEADRDKFQMQLIQSQKMESVGRLAGGVAHDFNNMLSVILGNTEMAMERLDPSQPVRDNLQEIQNAAQRSTNVVRQLLAFARRQTIAPQVLDLNKIVGEMLNILRRLIGEDIDLSWHPGPDIWPIKMDPTQIDQIMANLIVNARDAIHGVGKLIIETDRATFDEAYCADHPDFLPGDYVLLSVSDSGSGMDTKTLENMFEPFFTTKEVGQGTGLGLATVYGIVKQNNGFINVYSEPNHGTSLKIYLPRHRTVDEPARSENTEVFEARGHETILVVEDEATILKVTRMMLEHQGYTVLTAATPGEAFDIVREHSEEIHLLLTDVVMPEMNGQDLAWKLLSFYPNLKCLFISGYTENVIVHHGILAEGVNFIGKPFSKQDLALKVRKVLDE
ncbi:MAG: PAS domain S-box protein [Desulfovermiculus sp.]